LRYGSRVRRALTLTSTALVFALQAGAPTEARANGRFPATNALFFAPTDPSVVLLRTTFGEIVSHDRGATWDWVCERSIGLVGVEDPMYAITADGTLLASSFQGLAISADRACNFGFAGGVLKDLVMVDVAARPATPSAVVALASSYDGVTDAGVATFKSTLFETTDDGKTFAALGPPLDPSLLGETVDLAPSDPARLYISAVRHPGPSRAGVLLTSRDHGQTYEENPIALIGPEASAFIAAVDPLRADRLYVRTVATTEQPASRLLVTDDAGKTFRTIFTGRGPLAGFAISDDGATVWVGGPLDGLHRASASDYAFTQISTIEVQCLKVASDGLWACSNEKSGFAAGLSTDNGATFVPRLHFCDVRGPLACAAGSTTYQQCTLGGPTTNPLTWPMQRSSLGCDGPSSDGGAGDGSTDGGASGAVESGGGGCAVRAPSASPLAALFAGLAGLAATIALARRRRR
jgi:hypothetical protein